jgi:predicted TIM-barrel fold metal-dependent hydrolase
LGADGIKLYPAQYYRGRARHWRMDDPALAYPIFDTCLELGISNVAVHKALPLGPIPTDTMRVDDVGHAAIEYPDISFQIVHAGMMFLDETKMLIGQFPNVYATLESTFLLVALNPFGFATILYELILHGGVEKLIYASAATNPHPAWVLEQFARFTMPPQYPLDLTDEMRGMILGGNLARLHGIDIEAHRQVLEQDAFAKARRDEPSRALWSSVTKRLAQ